MVSVFDEVTIEHGALPVAVRVRVTLPAVISAALGVYVGVKVVPPVKVPLPLVVQFTLTELGELAPVIATPPPVEQVDWFPPAFGAGAATMVKVLVEVTLPQGEFPVPVKVRVTEPAVISPALGV